jgi:hypothetical protein
LDVSGAAAVSANVFIGKTTGSQTLDVSGSMAVSQISYVSNISEKVVSPVLNSGTTTNLYNLNYSQGSIFYLQQPTDASGTITCNLLNLPSLTNPFQTYVVSTIVRGTSGPNCYCANVYVTTQSTATGGFYYTPKFNSTPSVSNITSSNLVIWRQIKATLRSGFLFNQTTGTVSLWFGRPCYKNPL